MVVDFADVEAATDAFIVKWQDIEKNYQTYRAAAVKAASAYYDWQRVSEAYAGIYDTICGVTTRTILGVPIWVGAASQAVELLDTRFDRVPSTIVAFANKHALNIAFADENVRAIMRKAVVLNDGLVLISQACCSLGKPFRKTSMVRILSPTISNSPNTAIGFSCLVVARVRPSGQGELLQRQLPRHQFVGCHHGYFANDQAEEVNAIIKTSRADVILVGMGNPKQEIWLAANLEATNARLGFAVGALFVFVTGEARRAPAWMRTLRIEWVHRLAQEPWRLSRRYLLGIPLFFVRILSQRFCRAQVNVIASVLWSASGAVDEKSQKTGRFLLGFLRSIFFKHAELRSILPVDRLNICEFENHQVPAAQYAPPSHTSLFWATNPKTRSSARGRRCRFRHRIHLKSRVCDVRAPRV